MDVDDQDEVDQEDPPAEKVEIRRGNAKKLPAVVTLLDESDGDLSDPPDSDAE